jgi:hypothetical protein
MANLPSYKPSGRSFVPAAYPVKKKRTISGRTIRVLTGPLPSDGSMILVYGGQAGLLDSEAAEFVIAWNANVGVVQQLTLPNEVFAGMSTKLRSAFQDVLQWSFSKQPPRIEPTIPGRSRVTVTLEHRLASGRL